MEMIHIFLYAIVPIFVVMFAGYLAGKKGIFNAESAKAFNKIVLDYALPAALFVSIVDANRAMLLRDLKLAIVAVVAIIACFMLVYVIYGHMFKNNTRADGAVMALICGSPTIGFLGFAVLEPIFGTNPSVALVVAIVGIVVNAIGIPLGLSLLNSARESMGALKAGEQREGRLTPVLHALSQPVAWAPILAVIWVLLGIPWPQWASPSLNLIKGANASMAVFAAGITLSNIKMNINWQVILGCILKLVAMPTLALVLGLLLHLEPTNLKMLVVACALPPAFSGIIIAGDSNTYVSVGTSTLALNMLLFVAFCPLWIWITDVVIRAY
jgi:hypothetical protein